MSEDKQQCNRCGDSEEVEERPGGVMLCERCWAADREVIQTLNAGLHDFFLGTEEVNK